MFLIFCIFCLVVSYCFSGLDFMADVRGGIAKVVISRTGPTKNDACITMKTSDDTAIGRNIYKHALVYLNMSSFY